MAAWRYEIPLLVLKKYFTRSLRSLIKYFSTREEKFRISKRPCNILYLTWQPYSEDAAAYWYYFSEDRRVNCYSNLHAPLPVHEPNIWLNPTLLKLSFPDLSYMLVIVVTCTKRFCNLNIKLQIWIKQNSKISCSTSRNNIGVTNR